MTTQIEQPSAWHCVTAGEISVSFEADLETGLSSAEVTILAEYAPR